MTDNERLLLLAVASMVTTDACGRMPLDLIQTLARLTDQVELEDPTGLRMNRLYNGGWQPKEISQ